jgi:hypothetical protein
MVFINSEPETSNAQVRKKEVYVYMVKVKMFRSDAINAGTCKA